MITFANFCYVHIAIYNSYIVQPSFLYTENWLNIIDKKTLFSDLIILFFVFSSYPQRWWRRVYVEEFYPIVHLGDPYLEHMLDQHGLKVRSDSTIESESVWNGLNIDFYFREQTDVKFGGVARFSKHFFEDRTEILELYQQTRCLQYMLHNPNNISAI